MLSRLALRRGLATASRAEFAPPPPPEYVDEPQYPPIDVRPKIQLSRIAECERVREIGTVEEKVFRLNMPRYYGWKCYEVTERPPLHAREFALAATRTEMTAGLPDSYSQSERVAAELADELAEGARAEVEAAAKLKPGAAHAVDRLHRFLINALAERAPHLLDAEVDRSPRHEAFWDACLKPPVEPVTWKTNEKISFIGRPLLAMRSRDPLRAFAPRELERETPPPSLEYDPSRVGYHKISCRRATEIPGFWTGDSSEFGLVSFHSSEYILDAPKGKMNITAQNRELSEEKLDVQGIFASFGWLMAQAVYQGFNYLNDITYPLATQTILTNGRVWSFYAYQMNITELIADNWESPKRNICHRISPVELYKGVDDNGKISGFDPSVLKMLIQFYLNAPEPRPNVEMKPYLNKDAKHVADIEDVKRRKWVENQYKHIVSHRPRHRLLPETFEWEKIYKVWFNTRPLDPRRKWYETFQKSPWLRRLNEHDLKYVPKHLRPLGKRDWLNKREKTYYP